jgi:ribosomal protein S18 acetylase RimI-like enzyme
MAIEFGDIRPEETGAVQELWHDSGLVRPWNNPARDIAFALSAPCATVLVGRVRAPATIIASAMVGHDGHRGAVYYVAVHREFRGKGHGRAIVLAAEGWLRDRGVWKLNLLIRSDNAAAQRFYEALGFRSEERISMQKEIDPGSRRG